MVLFEKIILMWFSLFFGGLKLGELEAWRFTGLQLVTAGTKLSPHFGLKPARLFRGSTGRVSGPAVSNVSWTYPKL